MDLNGISVAYAFQPSQPHLLSVWMFYEWIALVASNAHVHTSKSATLEKNSRIHKWCIRIRRVSSWKKRDPHTNTHTRISNCQMIRWQSTVSWDENRFCVQKISCMYWTYTRIPGKMKMNCMKLPVSKVQFTILLFRINSYLSVNVCVCKIWQIDFVFHTKTARIPWMKNVRSTYEAKQENKGEERERELENTAKCLSTTNKAKMYPIQYS